MRAVGLERLAAALEERLELAVHVEALGHPQQLLVERAQRLLGQRRARLAAHGAVELVLAGLRRPAHRLLQRVVRLADPLVGLALRSARPPRLETHAFAGELLRVELAHGRVILDPLVHQRLRVGGLVGLVVAEAAVADQVDQRVAAERLAGRPCARRTAEMHASTSSAFTRMIGMSKPLARSDA